MNKIFSYMTLIFHFTFQDLTSTIYYRQRRMLLSFNIIKRQYQKVSDQKSKLMPAKRQLLWSCPKGCVMVSYRLPVGDCVCPETPLVATKAKQEWWTHPFYPDLTFNPEELPMQAQRHEDNSPILRLTYCRACELKIPSYWQFLKQQLDQRKGMEWTARLSPW